jgi:hydroxymethylpyrimidine pyrophosphatase-like HAD family hydrolase
MNLPIKLISTDFDGTLFAEFENPPIPEKLQRLIGGLQSRGAKWVINTGRDMSGLLEALARSKISVRPDYLILVEREIHQHDGVSYVGVQEWNSECTRLHEEMFARVRADLPRLTEWVNRRFPGSTVYEDPFSPFCLLAGNNGDANIIHDYLMEYCRGIPNLTITRNDVYARFSHASYDKGTALAELSRRLGIGAEHVFAVGDHLNDVPMLSQRYARYLAAPHNSVESVKTLVRSQNGFVSKFPQGNGVADALEFFLRQP